jgi:hypothetical protein
MEIIELILDVNDKMSGIEAISVVESPAIESDFIALKSQKVELVEVNAEKRILMGAALIPNKHIYRKDKAREYYIFFSKNTVSLASQLYLKKSKQSNTTLEHEGKLKDMTVVESWIVDNPEMDKSRHYGLNVPQGTWMVSMKVDNEKVWTEFVKTGKVKGFSIEGYFADKVEMSNKEEAEAEKTLSEIKKIIEYGI